MRNIPTAAKLKIKENPVTITVTVPGLKKGDKFYITKHTWYNGEPNLKGYLNDSTKLEEIPAAWTNIELI